MVISLIHPSRSRPEKSFINSAEWVKKAGCETELLVMGDIDDPHRHTYEKIYAGSFYSADNRSVVEAVNKMCMAAKGEILVYLSDDFKCPDNWGQLILKEFEGVTKPILLKVDDCLQSFNARVVTIPIMNRALYNKLGYFFHPDFKSMFCDEHLFCVAEKLRAIKFAPHLKFPHEHYSNGKASIDETYKRSEANWDQGKAAFAKHKKLGFPV